MSTVGTLAEARTDDTTTSDRAAAPRGPDLPEPVRAALVPPLRVRRPPGTDAPIPGHGGAGRAVLGDDGSRSGAAPPGPPHGHGTLALMFALPGARSAPPDTSMDLRLASYRTRAALDPRRRQVPTPRAELPDPRPWCVRLVQATVEATAGDRPVNQLLRWTSREVFEAISAHAVPALSGAATRRRSTRPRVRSVHLHDAADGVVEGCATVHDGVRTRAVALRLEGLGGRWVCTALDLV